MVIFLLKKILISDQDDINSLYLKNAILSSSFSKNYKKLELLLKN